jgi:hypothetical protein
VLPEVRADTGRGADRVRADDLLGTPAKRPMLTQPAHVLVEAPKHANERQRIRVAAIASPWRGLSLLALIVHTTAGAGCRSPILWDAFLLGHNPRQNAGVVPDKSAMNVWEFRGNRAASLADTRNCCCPGADLLPQPERT